MDGATERDSDPLPELQPRDRITLDYSIAALLEGGAATRDRLLADAQRTTIDAAGITRARAALHAARQRRWDRAGEGQTHPI